jgi:hypothetical protein
MMDNFASVLRDKLRTDMNTFADDLASGVCRNFEEYQKLCGVIQGLALAERYLLDLVEAQQKDEEIDEPDTAGGSGNARNNSTGRRSGRTSPY